MERLKLYPHNEESSKKIIEAFNNGQDVVGILHATGTGKTLNALSLCLENPNKKIVYIVPTNSVGEHIKKVIENNPNLDLERDFPNLEFRTYRSLCNLSTKELGSIDADYLILDEFHHIGAPIWGARINTIIETHPNIKVFGMTAYTVRDRGTSYERDMANPNGNELFSNKIVSNYDLPDAMIEGVLPLPIYRSCYTQLQGMAEELEERILNRRISEEERKEYLKLLDAAKKRIAEAPSIKDVIIRNLKKNGKYIYFCPPGSQEGVNDIETIKQEVLGWLREFVAEEDIVFYQTTSELGDIGVENRECFYNDTDLEGKNTDGKLRIMFAINQYNEGVHAPNIDGVILGRGTSSDIVYFEQIGRALSVRGNTYEEFNKYMDFSIEELREIANKRSIDTSKLNTKEEIIEKLVAPVIIDLANNIGFIKQLENDLKDKVKAIQETKDNHHKRIINISDVSFDIEVLNEDLFNILINLREKLSCLSWEEMYELANEYYQKNENLGIPTYYKVTLEDGIIVNLGYWINNQRQSYKKGTLSEDRIRLLENIGMKWSIMLNLEWKENYKFAEEYYKKNGHLEIPWNYKVTLEEGTIVNLGNWIRDQRQSYKKGILSEDRIRLLENIGMKWFIMLNLEWKENYKLAEEYYKKNGHLEIPQNYKVTLEEGTIVNLGIWICTQRRSYKKGTLSKDRIRLLENIGMKWTIVTLGWKENYKLAEEYYIENGHLEIPQNYKVTLNDGTIVNLGSWILIQRQSYKKGTLSEDRIKLLENIEMKWSIKLNLKWSEFYKLAEEYYGENNHLEIPRSYKIILEDGMIVNLGIWINTQRQSYKKGTLSEDRIRLLENIGMKWTIVTLEWNEIYKQAEEYYIKNGHLEIQHGYKVKLENGTIVNLGSWINHQRQSYKKGILSEDRIKLLENIGMKWSIMLILEWEENYKLAEEYYIKNDHLEIPQNYKVTLEDGTIVNLGYWINNQRRLYKKGILSEDRIKLLENIGMKWEILRIKKTNDTKSLCEKCGLDCEKYSDLLRISYKVLSAKINYLNSNNIPLVVDNELNPIFFMSDINMQVMFGISLEELVKQYSDSNKKGGK